VESFDPVTRQGLTISNLFWVELAISAILLMIVVGVLVVALTRYRASGPMIEDGPQIHGNRRLEIFWTATPAITLFVIFLAVIQTLRSVDAAQPDAQPIVITGHQWWWQFTYVDQRVITANELHVPVGTPLAISLQSVDVIHSFHVPQFGWMQDLVPGKTNSMSVFVDRAGVYDGACNQYCGLQHAWMRLRVVADPPDQFNNWLTTQQQAATSTGSPGEQVFVQNTCVSCHTIRGISGATGTVGPDLTHFAGRATLGAGVLDNTPDNLRAWISNPQAIKPGVLMPAFSSLSSSELDALVTYLESLK
jgi:cytochrome c oxidase subunit 2